MKNLSKLRMLLVYFVVCLKTRREARGAGDRVTAQVVDLKQEVVELFKENQEYLMIT